MPVWHVFPRCTPPLTLLPGLYPGPASDSTYPPVVDSTRGRADAGETDSSRTLALLGLPPIHTPPPGILHGTSPGISSCTCLKLFSAPSPTFPVLVGGTHLNTEPDTPQSFCPCHLPAASPWTNYSSFCAFTSLAEIWAS